MPLLLALTCISWQRGWEGAVAGGPLVNQGTITAATLGGSFSIGSDLSAGGGRATLANLGDIVVANGDVLQVWGPVAAGNGTGEFDLANSGTLVFHEGLAISPLAGVAAGNTVAFQDGSASVLALDPAHFAATLSGFQAGNALDLTASNTQPGDYAAATAPGTSSSAAPGSRSRASPPRPARTTRAPLSSSARTATAAPRCRSRPRRPF